MSQPANDDYSQHLSDDEASYHEDASDNGTATNKPKQQQQLTPTTTTISNIKLLILKKEAYDMWAWRIKDGVVRILSPVSAAKIHVVEKKRKARTILLMTIPKEHLRRFHGMDDAKEIWEAIRTSLSSCSSKNLWKLVDSGMSSTSKVGLGYEIKSNNEVLSYEFKRKVGLGYEIKSNDEVLSYEEEMNRTVFNCTEEDFIDKPLYSRFSKTDSFKGVPHPLTGDYTPKPQQEIDESLYVYGKKGPQKPETSVSDDTFSENSVTTNEKVMSEPKPKEVEPSCVTHVKTPRQPMKNQGTPKVNGKNWNEMMERELGEGYSFIKKKCFVCGSLSHLIRNCDFYEKKMAREAELKKQRVFNTGNGVAKPVWNNANRVNHANHFVPRPVQLIAVRQNVNSVRPNVNTGRANVNSVRQNVNSVRSNVNTGSFNINTVKAKQPINTSNSNSFSPVRPQVNKVNQRSHFSKSHSPVRRPIVRNTAKMTYSHAVKGNWGTAVKTSAGYNWRNTRPNSNYNSGSNFVRSDHPLKNMEDRGIFDSGCSGHMTGNKDHLDDFEECKGGSVTFGGSKGYITGYTWIALEHGLKLKSGRPILILTATATTLAYGTLELRATIDTLEHTITEASVQTVDQPSPSEPLPTSSHPPVISATTKSEPTLVAESIAHLTSLTPEPDNPTHPHVAEERTITVDDLLQLVSKLITKVDSLETELKQTKLTMGKSLVKLVKKVKKMEDVLKRRHVVLPDSEDEDAEILPNRGGIYQEEGLDENDFSTTSFEDISTGFEEVNTGGLGVSTGSGPVSSARGQREGKAPMIVEETQAPKRTKEQIQQEEASLAEAIRLQTLEEEETAKQVHLDALLAKRLAEEEELTEQQKKRKAQVQFEAQFYTEEDWDAIRAKLEANAELTKDVLGKDLSEQDFAKRMVDLVNQRKKHFAEERAKAKRNKPMTQSQLRIYMSNYLKNQGTWKLSQLKKLKFEEIKEEFEKLVKQIDTFVPINIEATKAQLKRYGEELQTEISKKQRIDDKDVSDTEEKVGKVKEEEPVKRVGKRKKQKARKGISIDKSPQGDSETDKEESVEAMNPTPLDTKSNIVANWKIFQQGERSIYQIIRANGADTVYMSFGAMLKDFTREDLIELYRLVMQKYGTNRPEDAYDRVLWSDLRTMFDPPLNEDAIWSLPLQQKMISWRYYDKCAVHCLTLEACNIYMLADRKYPLSKDACQVMLKMKLLDGKMNEVCYKLLKMIEKQAGLATPEQTATGKEYSNPLIADDLLKIIDLLYSPVVLVMWPMSLGKPLMQSQQEALYGQRIRRGRLCCGLCKWLILPAEMLAGWRGPMAVMDEEVILIVDEIKDLHATRTPRNSQAYHHIKKWTIIVHGYASRTNKEMAETDLEKRLEKKKGKVGWV
ncbi:hypothetical protein Tco_0267016 [Tanacetum coccineum]